ncbi:hypothetical protein FBZ96_105683 [Bradyrhizobium stylosanthis]|uniref:Uncharacterized protein n=1 Tax=Bradyrhizobium stylosanthis TaxID=1803665 RepID=A0A560DPF4_9BRAD|nr:hypothetical protein FBZ96_105683 [Bradyrhizobium stylosanthis]
MRMASQCRGVVMIAATTVTRKSFVGSDCRGASIRKGFGCRVRWRSSKATFAFERGTPAIAFEVHLDGGGMVNEAICQETI